MKNGGGYVAFGSHGYVYGPGGQGVLKDYNGRDVLYFHYGELRHLFPSMVMADLEQYLHTLAISMKTSS